MLPRDRDSLLKLYQLRGAFSRNLSLNFIEITLQAKGDINFRVPDSEEYAGCTALHFAKKGDEVEFLIRYEADFTIKNNKNQTALLQRFELIELNCIAYSHDWGLGHKLYSKVVGEILLAHVEKLVTTNPGNENGLTHFHIACLADHLASVEMFLNGGVPVDLAVGDDSSVFPGCTALHIAVRSCALDVVKALLKCGADPCAKDGDGMTVMHWLLGNSIKIIDSLMIEKINIVDRASWMSKLQMNQEIIYLLLKSYKFSSPEDEIGLSKFHIACSIGDASVAEDFWSQETQIDHRVNADSYLCPGYTALHFAAYFDINTVHMLLDKGADMMAQSTDGITPFDICLERYSIDNIHLIMSLQPSWQNITLLGGKVQLLHLISAMKDVQEYRRFLDDNIDDINSIIVEDSPLWPGFTPLHLAVMLSEQPKNGYNYLSIGSFDADLALIEECLDRGANVTAEDVSGCTPLHLAFRHQRTLIIETLLQFHHSSANPIDEDNLSHLHIACASGDEDVVKKLLQSGADPNLRVSSHFKFYRRENRTALLQLERIHAGSTPLHVAVAGKNSEMAKLLVKNDANVNITDDNGATPIHCLLVQGSEDTGKEIAETLLSADPVPVTLSGAGITHLHVASYFGHVDAVTRLLDLGADVHARSGCQAALKDFHERYDNGERSLYLENFAGVTALHNIMGRDRIAKILISRGADLLMKSPCGESPLDGMLNDITGGMSLKMLAQVLDENEAVARRVREDYGLTYLHLAGCEADPEAVKALIDAGANVNAQMTDKARCWTGYTPLHVIIKYSRSWTIGADTALYVNNRFRKGFLQTVRVLLDAGADVNLCDARGNTPLHLIANNMFFREKFNGKLLGMMLNSIKDFRVNRTGEVGMSHFHVACLLNNEMAIEKFLEHGVDVTAAIDFLEHNQAGGSSALHLLTQKTFQNVPPLKVETVVALLAHGADVDAQNADGDTVLHTIARFTCHRIDLFQILLRAGANLAKLNIFCETPFATLLQSEEATPQVVKLFIEYGCIVNQFNVANQRGFLAGLLCVSGNVLADRTSIFNTLFASRDITKLDVIGRTAIHNIVSGAGFRISEDVSVEEYCKLIERLRDKGCHIDAQDESGETALHLAAQFKNNKAIPALLINGADVNVIDAFEKAAFTYGADICKCKSIERPHRHTEIINTFFVHLKKMEHLNLHISNVNENIMTDLNVQPDFEADVMEKFYEEVNEIRLFKFEENLDSFNLIDMLSETGLVAVYPLKASVRFLVNKFFRNINVYLQGYTEIIGLLLLQFGKAVKRIELDDLVAKFFNRAVAFALPETCSRIVLRHLSNSDLENLIRAL